MIGIRLEDAALIKEFLEQLREHKEIASKCDECTLICDSNEKKELNRIIGIFEKSGC